MKDERIFDDPHRFVEPNVGNFDGHVAALDQIRKERVGHVPWKVFEERMSEQ
jgi:hypothetical protein